MAAPISNGPAGSYISRDEIYLSRLRYQHEALEYTLYALTEEQIRQRVVPDKWSVFENLAHLVRYQEVFADRLEIILKHDMPVFERYVADDDPVFYTWVGKPLPVLVQAMREKRKVIVSQVTGLQNAALQRIGVHPAYGRLNVNGWIEFFLLHEAHHLFTIFKLTSYFRQ